MTDGLGFGRRKLVDNIILNNWNIEDPKTKTFNYNEMLFLLQELLYEEGKPYMELGERKRGSAHMVFREFVKHLLYRNIANYDSMVLITADKGAGKSSAAIMMAREWCRLLGKRFDPERHIAYNNADMMRKIDELDKFECIIADEAVRFACVAGDTSILTSEGNIIIKDLIDKKFQVYSYNKESDKIELKNIGSCMKIKKDLVFEIEMSDGKKIKTTKEHKFLTIQGWKKLSELKIGDEIKTRCGWDKIKSIKKIGIEDVYDIIDVEDNNNYIANDVVVHNSAAEWAKKENKELKKKLAQIRTKHLLFILCFPLKIYKLEKTYLESYTNYWCLDEKTKILIEDDTGMKRNYPIGELRWKKNYKVATYNLETKEIEYKIPEKCIKTHKEAEVYELELENNQKIIATKDHPFLTKNGYKKLEELNEDDEIIVRTKICPTCKKEFIPKKEQMIYCTIYCKEHSEKYMENNCQNIKIWREKNPEKDKIIHRNVYLKKRKYYLQQAKKYREKYRNKINEWAAEYRKNNVELLRERDKKYREKNHEHYIQKCREKYYKYMNENLNFKIRQYYKNRLNTILKKNNIKKNNLTLEYLGCTIGELREYLEKQFEKGMSWSNHSFYGWHIDHIIPCCSFNLVEEEEQKKCFHYTNLQPLWAKKNLIKGGKYDWSESKKNNET